MTNNTPKFQLVRLIMTDGRTLDLLTPQFANNASELSDIGVAEMRVSNPFTPDPVPDLRGVFKVLEAAEVEP